MTESVLSDFKIYAAIHYTVLHLVPCKQHGSAVFLAPGSGLLHNPVWGVVTKAMLDKVLLSL